MIDGDGLTDDDRWCPHGGEGKGQTEHVEEAWLGKPEAGGTMDGRFKASPTTPAQEGH